MHSTTSSLLEGLLDSKSRAWEVLDNRFRPALVGFARRLGLPQQDAADAAQETLIDFFRSYGTRYQRERGRLHSWMFAIARRNIINYLRARARAREQSSSDTQSDRIDLSTEHARTIWLAECRQTVLWIALSELPNCSRLKPQTIRAFVLFAVEGRPAGAVAQDLGMTVEAVYMAKHHCTGLLRRIVIEIARDYGVNTSAE